jgi:hypothetical protein
MTSAKAATGSSLSLRWASAYDGLPGFIHDPTDYIRCRRETERLERTATEAWGCRFNQMLLGAPPGLGIYVLADRQPSAPKTAVWRSSCPRPPPIRVQPGRAQRTESIDRGLGDQAPAERRAPRHFSADFRHRCARLWRRPGLFHVPSPKSRTCRRRLHSAGPRPAR